MTNADKIIEEYAEQTPSFVFIQIGAFDGITGDPIFALAKKYLWTGILVEPQSDAFELLVANYNNNPNISFENIAISDTDGTKILYGVQPVEYDTSNHGQLHSFNKDVILKHAHMVKGLEDRITEVSVPTMTLSSLMNKHAIKTLDLLQIDTEGYDYEIIKQIDFGNSKPHFINFEHKHLSDADKSECYALLEQNNYRLIIGEYNVLAELID